MISKFRLTTITPLYIGSNDFLSPYTDFFYLDNKVYYLSLTKLIDSIPQNKVDDFLQEFYKLPFANKSSQGNRFSLIDFCNNYSGFYINPASGISNLTAFAKYSVLCKQDPEEKVIRKFISSSGKIFIPGSSIKGVIKTAILYDFLMNTKKGQDTLELFLRKLDSAALIFRNKQNEIAHLERLRKSGKSLRNKSGIRHQIDKIISPVKQRVNNIIKILESDVFSNEPGYDFMRQIIISDSNKLHIHECIQINEIKRIRFSDKNGIGSPMLVESVKDNSTFEFTVKLNPSVNILNNNKYFEQLNISKIMQLVDAFSKQQIKYELTLFENDKYLSSITLFNKNTLNSQYNGSLFRLGGNKSFMYNTIIGLLPDHYFKILREIMRIGENPFTGELVRSRFPSTQRFIVNGSEIVQPPGWCIVNTI